MERHIQTILLSVITAGILFVGSTLFDLSMKVTAVQVKLDGYDKRAENFATMDDMAAFNKMVDKQMDDFEKRLSKAEARIEKLKP